MGDILERLIAFNTISERSNKDLSAYVRDYLTAYDIPFEISEDPTGEKVAILATVGPMINDGVVLSGHTDVVPVTGQSWTSDPFLLRRDGDRFVGRGAVDMKGFCAAALAALPRLRERPLKRPLHLLLSYDEETSGIGSLSFIESFGRDLPRPSHAIIGEPTEMQVAIAHKGLVSYQTKVSGIAAHASRPADGVNAIDIANEAMTFLRCAATELQADRLKDARFDPSFTTVHVGWINGGTAANVVPSDCTFEWEVRSVPGVDDGLVNEKLDAWAAATLTALQPTVDISTTTTCMLPALSTDAKHAAVSTTLRLAKRDQPCTVPYATEAGHFQRAGIAAVVCGPGSVEQAHRPDEYIRLSELQRCGDFITQLGDSLCV
ncbi:hypothetical protein UB31_12310 [Bradyrhizobium sp. LTSP849]|nr:hypothetical protein UB31_12310 [Bradyrhizobium sp. LTSP849]KJC53137.1 hypothetical protein UP06_01275 [Bradyrhizobium sp. LTSP857]